MCETQPKQAAVSHSWMLHFSTKVLRSERKKVFIYRLLEVYCPRLKTAGQVSTPHRDFAVVLKVGLEETANTEHAGSPVLFKKMTHTQTHTHTVFTRLSVLRFKVFCRELSEVVIIKRVPRRLRVTAR